MEEMQSRCNSKDSIILLFQNTHVFEMTATSLQISRISDVLQARPLNDRWQQKTTTKYMLETKAQTWYLFLEDLQCFCHFLKKI